MTLYAKRDVIRDFSSMHFANPNQLEAAWGTRLAQVRQRYGICFATTKIVNLPLNKVQTMFGNRYMDSLKTNELLDLFNQGKKIDIAPLFQMKNKAAHVEYEPTFILR